MKPHLRRQIRLTLFQWHRRSGLVAALIIALVTLTGIALNHTGSLELDKQYPQSSWVLLPYESAMERPDGVELSDIWWWSDGLKLYRNQIELMPCRGLLGAASIGAEHLLQCDGEWLWLSQQGELLDSLDPALFELPLGASIAADELGFLVRLESRESWQRLDLDMYQLMSVDTLQNVRVINIQSVPDTISSARNTSISWQRVVLDLHSGRWFGTAGPWVVDIAALILLFLAGSGFWIWYSRRH